MAAFYAQYPASAASANASVGPNADPIPGSSTLVAGENPSGDLQPLQTDASGALIVAPASISDPHHVIVDSSALPLGAATEAKQDDEIMVLNDIDTNTQGINTSAGEISTNTLAIAGSTASLDTKATTTNASLSSIDSKLTSPLTVTGPLTDTQLRAAPVPVSGTIAVSNPGLTDTQLRATPVPVSVSGVATAANQTTEIAALNAFADKTASALVAEPFDEMIIAYIGATTDIDTITYELSGVLVGTVTLSYDGQGRLTGVVRS